MIRTFYCLISLMLLSTACPAPNEVSPPDGPKPQEDCNGDPDGAAYLDDCDECVGGKTGLEPCVIEMTDGGSSEPPATTDGGNDEPPTTTDGGSDRPPPLATVDGGSDRPPLDSADAGSGTPPLAAVDGGSDSPITPVEDPLVYLGFDASSTSTNIKVMVKTDVDIAGLQFKLAGAELTSQNPVTGGAVVPASWTMTLADNNMFLAFSMMAESVSAQSVACSPTAEPACDAVLLLDMTIVGFAESEICLNEVIISDGDGIAVLPYEIGACLPAP